MEGVHGGMRGVPYFREYDARSGGYQEYHQAPGERGRMDDWGPRNSHGQHSNDSRGGYQSKRWPPTAPPPPLPPPPPLSAPSDQFRPQQHPHQPSPMKLGVAAGNTPQDRAPHGQYKQQQQQQQRLQEPKSAPQRHANPLPPSASSSSSSSYSSRSSKQPPPSSNAGAGAGGGTGAGRRPATKRVEERGDIVKAVAVANVAVKFGEPVGTSATRASGGVLVDAHKLSSPCWAGRLRVVGLGGAWQEEFACVFAVIMGPMIRLEDKVMVARAGGDSSRVSTWLKNEVKAHR